MDGELPVPALGNAGIQLAQNRIRGRLLQTRQWAFGSTKCGGYLDFFKRRTVIFRFSYVLLQWNQLDATISQIYSWNETLHVSDSSSVHHQEFFTVDTAMVYVSNPVWHIPLLCVQWKTTDDGQRKCPKHVDFHSKNKFEKLLHLVGFIIGGHN